MERGKIAALCLFCWSLPAWSVTVLDPGYRAEVYASYSTQAIGGSTDFTFGPDGTIYVAHSNYNSTGSGSIQHVTASGITPLCSNLVDPVHIEYGVGDFGNSFYVSDRLESRHFSGTGEITRVGMDGSKTAFAGGLSQPVAMTMDPATNGKMYIANSTNDNIVRVCSAGGTVSPFSPYPFNSSGAVGNLAFDTAGSYGGGLFAATSSSNMSYSGLFQIDADGTASRYVTWIDHAAAIAFDTTANQDFLGQMYIAERMDTEPTFSISRIDQDLNVYDFAATISPSWYATRLRFGPDGDLYVLEWNSSNQTTTISRITAVPEPATLLLTSFGLVFLKRRR